MAPSDDAVSAEQAVARGGRARRADPRFVRTVGAKIAAFHKRAAPTPDHGGAAGMHEVVAGNAEDLRRSVPDVFDANEVGDHVRWGCAFRLRSCRIPTGL